MTNAIFQETTSDITVSVRPEYMDDQSDPDQGHYTWAYHVRIENNGERVIQLLSRHWKIADSLGNCQEIVGDGIVGHQPTLGPGDSFEYSSGTPLAAPSGFMSGSFNMISEDGIRFDIAVPAFALDGPDKCGALH
jgi:ApaG protein